MYTQRTLFFTFPVPDCSCWSRTWHCHVMAACRRFLQRCCSVRNCDTHTLSPRSSAHHAAWPCTITKAAAPVLAGMTPAGHAVAMLPVILLVRPTITSLMAILLVEAPIALHQHHLPEDKASVLVRRHRLSAAAVDEGASMASVVVLRAGPSLTCRMCRRKMWRVRMRPALKTCI